jgi:hypothetical protein
MRSSYSITTYLYRARTVNANEIFLAHTDTGSYLKLRKETSTVLNTAGVAALLKRVTGEDLRPIQSHASEGCRDTLFPLPPLVSYSTVLAALEQAQAELGIFKISVTHVTLATVLHNLASRPEFEHELTQVRIRHSGTQGDISST